MPAARDGDSTMDTTQKLKFYQKGTLTVGNRLVYRNDTTGGCEGMERGERK